MKAILLNLLFLASLLSQAQTPDVVPKAKTKAQRKAENKNKSLKEKVENVLPVEIDAPTPTLNAPGGTDINSPEDAKKFLSEELAGINKKIKKGKSKVSKILNKDTFDGKKFEGFSVQKKVLKKGSGSRLVYQEFYVLKATAPRDPYLRNLTWLNLKTRKLVEAITRDANTNVRLHGPYKEYRGENVAVEGQYYLGAKHGRWLYFDKEFMLVNKEYYKRGFPEQSIIKYIGADSTKIEEVFPVVYGDTTGAYFKFFDDTTLAEEGFYDNGHKVGKWVEYHRGGNKRKKETQYPKDMFDKTEPYVIREYDQNGKMVFEHKP